MSYDSWKSTNPADNELGQSHGHPEPYGCLDCAWRGKGYGAASAHFWANTGHNVKPLSDPRFKGQRQTARTA